MRIFTRYLNDVTAAVPEIVEAVRGLAARSLILDGEALACHPDGRPRPFQLTMRRFGRKLDVERLRESIPLYPFFFDCLFIEDSAILDWPGAERSAMLASRVPEGLVVSRRVTGEKDEAEASCRRLSRRAMRGSWQKLWTRPMKRAHAAAPG